MMDSLNRDLYSISFAYVGSVFFKLTPTDTTKFLFEDARCIADEGDLIIIFDVEYMRYDCIHPFVIRLGVIP